MVASGAPWPYPRRMDHDIYFYGTTVASTIHRLAGAFPALDTYGEIRQTWKVPGGEAMNGAMVLSRLGLKVRVGGPWLGSESGPLLRSYAQRYGIGLDLRDEVSTWPGLLDMILVDDAHRTVFGSFGRYFSDPVHRWDPLTPEALGSARLACIDPWFPGSSDAAAQLCLDAGVPYVTIDSQPESPLVRGAAAVVVSGEYRRGLAKAEEENTLFDRYRACCPGLVVFSSGSGTIGYGRAGGPVLTQSAFAVEAVSTLGAGDVFRAGIAWGLLEGRSDQETVRRAAALAALSCTRMPIADTAPSQEELEAFLVARS